MVLISDGNSEIGAHVSNNIYYLNLDFFLLKDLFPSVIYMVLILDGNTENVAHGGKKINCVSALDLIKCLKQIKHQILLLHAHLFLSYHLI